MALCDVSIWFEKTSVLTKNNIVKQLTEIVRRFSACHEVTHFSLYLTNNTMFA